MGIYGGLNDTRKSEIEYTIGSVPLCTLTDTVNPRDYIKKMLRRDPELKSKWGTICPPVEMIAPDGKRRKTQASKPLLQGVSSDLSVG